MSNRIFSIDGLRALKRAGGDVPVAPVLRHGFDSEIETRTLGEKRLMTFRISTASVDRMGDTIALDGWQLGNYLKNPVVLWGHDASSLPVAKATKVWTENGALVAEAEFTAPGLLKLNDAIWQLLQDKYLNATSVGFRPLKYAFSDDPQRRYGIDFLEQELLEFSIVTVPANAEALVEGRAASEAREVAEIAPINDAARRKRRAEALARVVELQKLRLAPPAPAMRH